MSDDLSVKFPKVSQVVTSRRDIVGLIWDNFEDAKQGPVLLISGSKATRSYAEAFCALIREEGHIEPRHVVLERAPEETEAKGVAQKLADDSFSPTLVIYVGGQTVGDSAKLIAHEIRQRTRRSVTFGGVMTALSNDGVVSVTASLRDQEGLPKSVRTVAPDFVLGHSLTLLRQPYEMKISCVGDIVAKASSLWDYNYSCRALQKYHHDFAADLTKTAYEIGLSKKFTKEYLHDPESINELYRSVQLCGLSMQLTRSSETCSGSEHVGQKWVDEFTLRYNKRVSDRHKRLPMMAHGQAVIAPTLTTLHLQGQAKRAKDVREVANRIGLKCKMSELGVPARVLQSALVLGVGFRCPNYITYLLAGGSRPTGDINERVTVLEEIEVKVLPDAIKNAMLDAEVATESDFQPLDGMALNAMQMVRRSAISQLTRGIADPAAKKKVSDEILNITRELIPSEDES